ncbi:MAG: Mrp/NBP35 family ATP-binding protein [Planctomycetota bacterium]|nr:Mrp/NBP35 family ATP-binding protein [Planctomycetota bacterium]
MAKDPAPPSPPAAPPLAGVRRVIAVASGKGGVGKSTTAINLAVSLKQTGGGASVGLLDADIYGPSMAMMFGIQGRPQVNQDRKMLPLEGYGIKVISMSFLSDPDKPVIWRGPMVHGLLQQFVRDVDWGTLDYLVIDLPPGTGDAQLSLSQIIDITGVVIVTTPQDVSLIDARKGLQMFRQMKVPVLGIVENMSYFACPHCGERTEIFRSGGGQRAAAELSVPFLGAIPLDPAVVVGGDEGRPVCVADPEAPASQAFTSFATKVVENLKIAAGEERPQQAPIMPDSFGWK